MFLKAKLTFSIALTLLASAIFYSALFCPIINARSSKYKKFSNVKKAKINDGIYQSREGISKDMWVSKDGQRFFYHMESPSSQFRWVDDEMVEVLNQMALWIQDKDTRYLKATQGNFHYKRKHLDTYNTFISSYKDSEAPYFQGLADEISIHFRSYPPSILTRGFSASHGETFFSSDKVEYHGDETILKGNVKIKHGEDLRMYSEELLFDAKKQLFKIRGNPRVEGVRFGTLTSDGILLFNLETNEITAENGSHPLVFKRKDLKVHSNKITVHIHDSKPEKITFSEDVRLLNNSIFGIAERASYDCKDHSIQLVSKPDGEVYFWNRDKNFTLAAPAILIEGEVVRGIGKVRFTFEESEKENILKMLETCLKDTF